MSKNFDPDPYWSMAELENVIYKIEKVKEEKDVIYYLVYFFSDPKATNPDNNVVKYPWVIMVDAKSKGHDTIICKACISPVDSNKGTFGSFETNKEYRRKGYGAKFIKFINSKYHQNNLMVLINNKPAINLYKKLGFKQDGKYTLDDGKEYYYMELEDK